MTQAVKWQPAESVCECGEALDAAGRHRCSYCQEPAAYTLHMAFRGCSWCEKHVSASMRLFFAEKSAPPK